MSLGTETMEQQHANRRDRGAVIPIVALALPVLILMTAFAVDLGRQRADRRQAQARADVIALDMVRLADGRTELEILSDPGYTAYWQGSALRNGFEMAEITGPDSKLTIEYGTWNDSTDAFVPTLDDDVPNAAKVVATDVTDYSFQPGSGNVSRQAVATTDASAGFQVGSRLVSIDATQATLLNAVFTRALGGPVGLTAVGYNGLLNTTIPLGPLATQLGFGSPDELADATVGAQDFYLAAAQVMQNQGNTAAASALNAFATSTNGSTQLDMGQLMSIEQGGSEAAANGAVDLYSLVTGSVFAINGTNAITIPSLSVGVAGTSTTLTLSVIERPRFNFGPVGTTVQTQQAAVGLNTTVASLPLSVAGLVGTTVSGTIPLSVTLAGATGTLTDIDCAAPGISVGLTPQPATATTGLALDVRANVLFSNILVARVNVPTTSPVAVTGSSAGASFSYPDEFLPNVGTGTMKPAPTTSLALPGPLNVNGSSVTVVGAPLVDPGLLALAVNASIVTPVSNGLTAFINNQLNTLLGIDVGGADIGALDMTCESVKLVQ